jgi:hypothetical protein
VAKKIVDTLTSKILKTLYLSKYFVFLYELCFIAIAEHFELHFLTYLFYVVDLGLILQIVFFYSNIKFCYYSFTTKLLLLLIFIEWFFLDFKTLLSLLEPIISLMAAVSCRFMQDRHTDRYLGLYNCQF